MDKVIDIQNWTRKEEYLFFRTFLNPMISVTVEVDCTTAYRKAKERQQPFSLYYMHAAVTKFLDAISRRYSCILYERIDLFTPVQNADGSYRSVRLPAIETFEDFLAAARPLIEAAKRGEGEVHNEAGQGRDILLISVNPWYRFTNVQLAIPGEPHQNIPIFTFGKIEEREGKRIMPVALSVNHGFVSGYQIGLYLKEFQRLLNR